MPGPGSLWRGLASRAAGAGGRVALTALILPTALAGQGVQRGNCTLIWEPTTADTRSVSIREGQDAYVTHVSGGMLWTCGTATMRADSAVKYDLARRVDLIGSVRYRDTIRTLESDFLTYFELDDRVIATDSVHLTRLGDGSTLTGPRVEFLRAITGVDAETIATGRPHMVLYPEGDDPGPPFDVDADRTLFAGEEEARAFGDVVITRPDLHAEADSAIFRVPDGTGVLYGSPWVQAEEIMLRGDTIRTHFEENVLRDVGAIGQAHAEGESFEVRSERIDVAVENEEVDAVWAHGEGVAEAISGDQYLYGDSLRFAMFEGRLDTINAVGRAAAIQGQGPARFDREGETETAMEPGEDPSADLGAQPGPVVGDSTESPDRALGDSMAVARPALEDSTGVARPALEDSTGVARPALEDTTVVPDPTREDSIRVPEPVQEDSVGVPEPVAVDSMGAPERTVGDSTRAPDPVGEDSVGLRDLVVEDTVRVPDPVAEDSIEQATPTTARGAADESLSELAAGQAAGQAAGEAQAAADTTAGAEPERPDDGPVLRLPTDDDSNWVTGDTLYAIFEREPRVPGPSPPDSADAAAIPPDSAGVRSIPPDSVIAVNVDSLIPPPAEPDSAPAPILEQLTVIGNARSLYAQVRDTTVSTRPSRNYMIGLRIDIFFQDGEPERVEGTDAIGLYLDPLETTEPPGPETGIIQVPGDTTRIGVRGDTASVGAREDTTAVSQPPDSSRSSAMRLRGSEPRPAMGAGHMPGRDDRRRQPDPRARDPIRAAMSEASSPRAVSGRWGPEPSRALP